MRYVKTVLNWHLPFQRYYHLNKVKQAVNIRLKSNVCMWICCMDALTHTVAYDGEFAPLQSCGSHFTDHQPGSLSHYRTMWLFQTENTTTLPQTFSGFYSTDSEYTVNYSVLIRGAGQINVFFFFLFFSGYLFVFCCVTGKVAVFKSRLVRLCKRIQCWTVE